MKVTELDNDTFFVRLEKGEAIFKMLKDFHDLYVPYLKLCEIKGIGAIKNVELAYASYNEMGTISYQYKFFPNTYELTSFVGNLAIKDGASYGHIHLTMADEFYNVIGGHLKEAEVAITLELFIKVYSQEMTRNYDDSTGMFLLG